MIEIEYKDKTKAIKGDVIRWDSYDSDDNHTWTFTGVYKGDHVIYMGGGMDFGLGIGAKLEVKEVIEESLNNDRDSSGIIKVCSASRFAEYIGKI